MFPKGPGVSFTVMSYFLSGFPLPRVRFLSGFLSLLLSAIQARSCLYLLGYLYPQTCPYCYYYYYSFIHSFHLFITDEVLASPLSLNPPRDEDEAFSIKNTLHAKKLVGPGGSCRSKSHFPLARERSGHCTLRNFKEEEGPV